MSLTGDNTAKFWASCPKVLGNRRRSSSSGLFNISITEPILAKYKHLAKLHSDSSALGLNAVNRPSLPRGTLFRSSLPATPLTSPMYTGFLHQFTEKTIQELLEKSSTPEVVKSSSGYELRIDSENNQTQNQEIGLRTRTNLFNISSDQQNIISRCSLIRPKSLDIKSKIAPQLSKINENSKSDETSKSKELEKDENSVVSKTGSEESNDLIKNVASNHSLSSSLYYSIKEEQEELDSDCVISSNESKIELTDNKDVTIKQDSVISQTSDVTITGDQSIKKLANNHSTNETIVLDDSSSVIDSTALSLANVSIANTTSKMNESSSPNKKQLPVVEQNGVKHNSSTSDSQTDAELQPNCLFVKNLPYNVNNVELKDYFCKFGTVSKCTVIYDHHTKLSKCFGFVTFGDHNDVEKILSFPRDHLRLKGRSLQLSLARNKRK